jgi:SulP family sulfate permease
MENNHFVDQSGLYALEAAILTWERRNIDLILTGLQEQPRARMEILRIIPDLIGKDNVFEDFQDAITWLSERVK